MNKYVATFLAIITPYSVLISSLYLIAYWQTFHINIFQYISIQEILGYSIPALIFSFSIMIPYSLCIRKENSNANKIIDKLVSKISIRKFKLIFLNIYLILLIVFLLVLLYVEYLIYTRNPAFKYTVLLMGISFLISIYLSNKITLYDNYLDKFSRILTIFSLFVFPISSFTYGNIESYDIKNGYRYSYINSDCLKTWINEQSEIKYIGKAGDYFFLYYKDKTIIRKYDDFKCLNIGYKTGRKVKNE